MKISPIQLLQFSFRRVNVELDVERLEKGGFEKLESSLAFDGVHIKTNVGRAPMDEGTLPGTNYLLTLQVVIDNKSPEDGSTSKPSPYLVDIEAGAVIRVAPGAEAIGDIEDIVVVNGTSLLWSAIREQVCNLTARMPLGQATLPTVHFQDLRKPPAPISPEQAKRSRPHASKPAKPTT
jgi:hypothetical protein